MTRELIIEGERMDLAPDTNVTLEYVSNAVGDLGKINLSHSYTIKLPKTSRNSRILDAPGLPGHASQRTRRFLSARFIQNGVDLIGPAQAYILQTTPEAYELALVWNTLEPLQALSESDATINDLPNLPVLPWLTIQGIPDYTDISGNEAATGAFFATYDSGLGPYAFTPRRIKTAPHPCMRVSNLISRILGNAGVPYIMSERAQEAIGRKVVLAAPEHKPNRSMEIESGSSKYSGVSFDGVSGSRLVYDNYATPVWRDGWDATQGQMNSGQVFFSGDNGKHRILINLKAPEGLDFSNARVVIRGATYTSGGAVDTYEELLRVNFKADGASYYAYADEALNVSSWPNYFIIIDGEAPSQWVEFSQYDPGLPLIASNREHETIDLTKDNRFPLEGNLPDIKQWDFIKAAMVFCGLAPIIQNDALNFYTYAEILDRTDAYDWTGKVDMTDGGPEVLKYSLDGWAQKNEITFQENTELSADPTARMIVEDATIKESRKWFELPFAASKQSSAVHYKVTEAEDGTYEVEDIDIEPRIFDVDLTRLFFRDSMKGAGLIEAHYKELQAIVRTPVMLTANIRLHEVDLAKLDLTRPVYLGQFGQYYGILKIQTGSDLCKVELIQLS